MSSYNRLRTEFAKLDDGTGHIHVNSVQALLVALNMPYSFTDVALILGRCGVADGNLTLEMLWGSMKCQMP